VSEKEAKRLALIAVLVAGGMATVRALGAGDRPSVRIPIGMMVAGLGLTAAAELQPKIAGPLAALLLTTSVLVTAGPAWETILTAINRPTERPEP
jgi:hypothetical protein